MKQLFILRHTKAAAESKSGHDHDRPLNARGEVAARLVGEYLAGLEVLPEIICCSDALRTTQTLALLRERLDTPIDIRFHNELYLASAGDLLEFAHSLPESYNRVMLIGHNPGMHQLANILSGGGKASALQQIEVKFPTGGLAIIDFPSLLHWQDIAPHSGFLHEFWRPQTVDSEAL